MSGPHIFLVAGEHSGDQLGAGLVRALRAAAPQTRISGVGGPQMEAEGLTSLFPLSDISVMGFAAVLPRIPLLVRRIRQTAAAVLAEPPDALVIIDSPDFTHRVARAVRRRLPHLPVVDYVSPTVWAWRPGRAAAMRDYVDHVLALLPFEPEAYRRLGGPACTYVGHPLTERLGELRPRQGERPHIADDVRLLALPGSRASVAERHMPLFGEVLARLPEIRNVTIPAVAELAPRITDLARTWPVAPQVVVGEAAKLAAFRSANTALAASGTVTLELALSGVPMVGAYRVEGLAQLLKPFVRLQAPYILLPNLILDEEAVPELIDVNATPQKIAAALRPLLADTPRRRSQEAALARLDDVMKLDRRPSEKAADIVLNALRR